MNLIFSPTVDELEAQVAYLKDLLLTTRMHLRVVRKARARQGEGPVLPGFTEPPNGSGGLPGTQGEPEA